MGVKNVLTATFFIFATLFSWSPFHPLNNFWVSPLSAQTTCRANADCPCGQGCAEINPLTGQGQCRNLLAPACGGRIDPPCPRNDLFSGSCIHGLCELSCQAPPPSPLQSRLDACAANTICTLPAGTFEISRTLVVSKSIRVEGAGKPKARAKRSTVIRVADTARGSPAIRFVGDISASIKDLGLVGGGIKVGGDKDPVRISMTLPICFADLSVTDLGISPAP